MTFAGATRRRVMVAAAISGGVGMIAKGAWAAAGEGVSHTAEAIHQEPVFPATPARVYEALVDAKQFDKVVQLSGALQSMSLGSQPTAISPQAGGMFTLFGGHIIGRHIELTPNRRIVQAWRVVDWNPGVYSIAKFELSAQGSSTRIVFDHTGFPSGDGEHLAAGWTAHYWEPLGKYLGM